MANKCCYTAIFGNYEELKEPSVNQTGFDFVCFTDQPLKSDIWKIIPVTVTESSNQRMARKIKILPHVFLPEYEYTFWLDASFQINIDLNTFWNRYFQPSLSAPAHPIRNCVYREIASCIANKRGDEDQLLKQKNDYLTEQIPAFKGIITSGVLMRQKTLACVKYCNDWWDELSKHSARDQVAFAKISLNWAYNTFVWDYSQSKELKYYKHFHKRH